MKPFPEYRDWIQRPGDSSVNITSGAYAAQREAYYRDAGALIPSEKQVGGIDTNPHPSVQVWSRGELFPAVLMKTERYSVFPSFDEVNAKVGGLAQRDEYERGKAAFYGVPLADRLESSWYTVILEGEVEEGLATYDEAAQCARGMLAQRAARSVA